MNFIELAKSRRSVRKYSEQPVLRGQIEQCLEAVRLAPSACNAQPWTFIVADKNPLREELCGKAFGGIYATNAFAREAPVMIAVVSRQESVIAKMGGFFRGVSFHLVDIGIACEHLVLQAAELGIGTCYLGWFNEGAVKKILGLSKSEKVNLLISMGYPAQDVTKEQVRKNAHEIYRFVSVM